MEALLISQEVNVMTMRCQPIGFVNKHPLYASGKDYRSQNK